MLTLRASATALALVIATSVAYAQDSKPASPGAMKQQTTQQQMKSKEAAKSDTSSTTQSATDSVKKGADDVKNWTEKKWNSMKAEWQKNKAQWNACDQKAKDQKLTGKASWSFFYDCMKA